MTDFPDIFTEEIFGRYKKDEDAELMYRSALLGAIGLYDEEPWNEYVEKSVHILDTADYSDNFFLKNFKVPKDIKKGKLLLTEKKLKAFEGFEADEAVLVIWEVNRGEGWEMLDIGESCRYIVSAETMTWEFRARVQIQE